MFEPGCLVISSDNSLGIGKILKIFAVTAELEYFGSLGERTSVTVPCSSLKPVRLERHTRCYFQSEDEEFWQIGRVDTWHQDDLWYEVHLPNKGVRYVTEADIYVRYDRPISDPTDILVAKGHETPFFHARRSACVRCLIEQRAVSHGMPGLFSANINLYPHQVEVVRRVLEDPIQRYLLADEVGLGKTIEAGAILRQYLLDEPNGQGLAIVPRSLLKQWQQELESKFYLTDEVKLLTIEDLPNYHFDTPPGFLILDEAQHIAAMAESGNLQQQRCFAMIQQLCDLWDNLAQSSTIKWLCNNENMSFQPMLAIEFSIITWH